MKNNRLVFAINLIYCVTALNSNAMKVICASSKRPVDVPFFLVNRLDKTKQGLEILNHSKKTSYLSRINPDMFPYLKDDNIHIIKTIFRLQGYKKACVQTLSIAYINPDPSSSNTVIVTTGINGMCNGTVGANPDDFSPLIQRAKEKNESVLLLDLLGYRVVDAYKLVNFKSLQELYMKTTATYVMWSHAQALRKNKAYTYKRFQYITNKYMTLFKSLKPDVNPTIDLIGVSFSGVVLQHVLRNPEDHISPHIRSVNFICALLFDLPAPQLLQCKIRLVMKSDDDVLIRAYLFYKIIGYKNYIYSFLKELYLYSKIKRKYIMTLINRYNHGILCSRVWIPSYLDLLLNDLDPFA